MNLESNPTKQQLRELLTPHDDRAGHHVLWVDAGGEVHITMLPRVYPPGELTPTPATMRMRYETFRAGNGYVGQEAADDMDWIDDLFDQLLERWNMAKDASEPQLIRID